MNTLIRTSGGRETPAPGRWTIAPGQPVAGRTGRPFRRSRVYGRTTSGHLLITDAGDVAFQLRFGGEFGAGPDATTLTYQSISCDIGSGGGLWPVAGELIVDGHLTPARSLLIYHGVFRSGPGAVAWLGWQLTLPILRLPSSSAGRGVISRLDLTAQLNADAPADLTMSLYPNDRLRRFRP